MESACVSGLSGWEIVERVVGIGELLKHCGRCALHLGAQVPQHAEEQRWVYVHTAAYLLFIARHVLRLCTAVYILVH
eukprot:864728-Rhodomonas_salina.1